MLTELGQQIPPEVQSAISGEEPQFIVKAARAFPLKSAVGLLCFGTFWIAFSSIFVFGFLGTLLQGHEVHFRVNGVPTVAGPGNLAPLLFPEIIIGIFVLVGLLIAGSAISSLVRQGSWFAGTSQRLVDIVPGRKERSIDWENFNGDILAEGTNVNGTLILGLRTESVNTSMVRTNSSNSSAPKIIMAGISHVYEIEKNLPATY